MLVGNLLGFIVTQIGVFFNLLFEISVTAIRQKNPAGSLPTGYCFQMLFAKKAIYFFSNSFTNCSKSCPFNARSNNCGNIWGLQAKQGIFIPAIFCAICAS